MSPSYIHLIIHLKNPDLTEIAETVARRLLHLNSNHSLIWDNEKENESKLWFYKNGNPYRKWGNHWHWHYSPSTIVGFANPDKVIQRVCPPSGCAWGIDDLGFCVVKLSDMVAYHPTLEDWNSKNFFAKVRVGFAKIYLGRKAAKEVERVNNIRENQLANCRVLLEDSRRAGNCIEGTLTFTEKRLQIPREQILNASFLFGVSGDKLLKTGDGRARQAVICAWERETTLSI